MVPSGLNPAAEAVGAKDKALKNDEVFGCARSGHFGDFKNYHSEYHLLNCNGVVQVGPRGTITRIRKSLKFRHFSDFSFARNRPKMAKSGWSTQEKFSSTLENLASTQESTTELNNGAIESTIEKIVCSIDFANSSTDQKIIRLLRVDSSLTLDKLFPLLNLSRKGVQKAIERLKESGKLSREGSTKSGKWIVNNKD